MPGIHQRKSRDGAVVLADGEGCGVLQHLIGERLGRGRPDLADDRKRTSTTGPSWRSFSIAAAGLR
jgi:hypothetical protein